MPIPADFVGFDVANATVTVWLFKKSAGADGIPRFTGRWVETNDDLDVALKQAVIEERARITEVAEYSLLAQTNEGNALHLDAIVTHSGLITAQAAGEVEPKRAANLKQVQNTVFYAVKLVVADNVMYAVTKTDSSWRSRKAKDILSVFFADDRLGLDPNPTFSISKRIDFFIVGEELLISNKAHFESILSYKEAHAQDFTDLQAEPEFIGLFTNLAPLVAFVGDNKIHLRRACAIREKAHYKDANFIKNVRERHAQCGLTVRFDAQGRIDPSPDTSADIIRALLDHRLLSIFSNQFYDVPDAVLVQPDR